MLKMILYDGWMSKGREKKNGKYIMTKSQIRGILKLCSRADKTEFIKGGVRYYIK